MIKKYFKLAWMQAKSEKLYTGLYIGGVALSIVMVMTLVTVFYVRLAPIYPEYKRGDLLYLETLTWSNSSNGNFSNYAFTPYQIENWIKPLKSVGKYTAVYKHFMQTFKIQREDDKPDFPVSHKGIDNNFFNIYDFEFVEGNPFTQQDWDNRARIAIITDDLAQTLYGTKQGVIGKEVSLNHDKYKVSGVVRSGSQILHNSFADIYIPYNTLPGYDPDGKDSHVGPLSVIMIAKEGHDWQDIREEIYTKIKAETAATPDETYSIGNNFPKSHYMTVVGNSSWRNGVESTTNASWVIFVVIAVLLLIPSMNLSSLIVGRMGFRRSEIGVRKSFGASRSSLLWQVFVENLSLTLAGALVGFVLTWVVITTCSDWVFQTMQISFVWGSENIGGSITPEMLFSPTLFGIVLILTIILNILSSVIPAWWSLRHPIVESLNEKR